MFKDYFDFLVPSPLAKQLFETKKKKENNKLVEEIKNRWSNLKDEVEKRNVWRWKGMSEDEKEIEKPDKILKIVEETREINRQHRVSGLKNINTKLNP